MKFLLLHIFCLFALQMGANAQMAPVVLHPLSDPDVMYGKVAQTKEVFYDEPKSGAKIDTAEKRITWYDEDGNTQNMVKYLHTKTGWIPGPDFAIRLTKFGTPPVTTGKDSLNFSITYDSLGNEAERKNFDTSGKLYSKILTTYNPDHTYKKSEFFTNGNLIYTKYYVYEKGRLMKEHLVFPNHSTYDIIYKYEGIDIFNNWLKRICTYAAGTKSARVKITERRVIYYEQ